MKRSGSAAAIVAFLSATLVAGCSASREAPGGDAPAADEERPARAATGDDLLLITVDTLRADRLAIYGGPVATPALDQLAQAGVLFEQAVTPVPLTLPAHASILTGVLPPHHGVRDNGLFSLDDTLPTLAETLKAAGYRTGAFVSSFVLDRRYGLDRGFDVYDDGGQGGDGSLHFAERRAWDTAQSAVRWIFDDSRSEPFFCWIHFFDPHRPYDAPEPFGSRYADSPYDGEIAYTDTIIGELFTLLSDQGRLGRTLSVLTADHGEGLGDHGELTHGLALYDTTMRVPLLFLGPGVPSGKRSPVQARLTDLAPTILDLLGVAPPDTYGGRSLRPAIEGRSMEQLPAFLETTTAFFLYNAPPLFGVRTHEYKYIRDRQEELYDLSRDPGETSNRIDSERGAGRRLAVRLDSVLEVFPPLPQADVPSVEEIEKLQALGYLGRGDRVEGDFSAASLHRLVDDMMRAQGHLDAGRREAGREILDAVVRAYPDNVEALRLLADDALRHGETERALETYDLARSVARVPNPVVDLNRALCLEELGRREEAKEALQQVLAAMPDHPDALQMAEKLGLPRP